jgi:hypothetical protein
MADTSTVDRIRIQCYGGPQDGVTAWVDSDNLEDYKLAILRNSTGRPFTDEPYIMRWMPEDDSAEYGHITGAWIAVHRPLVKFPDRESTGEHLRETAKGMGLELPKFCEPGKHQFSEWAQTPRGNRTRHCQACGLTESDIF